MVRRLGALLAVGCLLSAAGNAATASVSPAVQQWETQVGEQEYALLSRQGKIVHSSPYYAMLSPVGSQVARVADTMYWHPFTFLLVNDATPNAFSVPGGNVYVTTGMMKFVQNREELAGVLCHESAHDIHHDVYNLARKNQNLSLLAGIAGLLIGRSNVGQIAVNLGAIMQSDAFSRDVEHNADVTGAYICAQANSNPWGMVWTFKRFLNSGQSGTFEALSDHPRDDHRITDLESLFASDPAAFGHFSSSLQSAHPLP